MSEWEGEEGEHWATNADRYTKMLAGFATAVTDAADYPSGGHVLDIGCGCGDLSLAAASAVGPTGRATGVDLSPAMLAIATARAASQRLSNVEFIAGDASQYTPNEQVDVVVSRFGVMFFDDPTAAFSNIHAAIRPGGRLVFACWQDMFANDWMIVPGAAVAEVVPLPIADDPNAAGPFAFSDAQQVTTILSGAGFSEVTLTPVTRKVWMGDTATDTAGFLRITGVGRALLGDAEPALVDEAMRRVVAVLEPYESPAGVELDGAAWVVTATA
jgi:SAM-dependent methyltransferase